MSLAISKTCPGAVVIRNKIPKTWVNHEIYKGLVWNDNPAYKYYGMNPRIDSFEITHGPYLIFSKLGGKYWPAVDLVAEKCATVAHHAPHNCDISNYLAGMGINTKCESSPSATKQLHVAILSNRLFKSAYESQSPTGSPLSNKQMEFYLKNK